MASQDDINSTLKNIVSNVGLLANATAVAASINSVQTAIINLQTFLSTALATTHLFGGSFTLSINQFSTVISDAHVVSNSKIVFASANLSAASTLAGNAYISTALVPGVSFAFAIVNGSSPAGGEIINYVGYNP